MPREPDLLPDWFVGGAGKRRLLRRLVSQDPTVAPWDELPPWSKKHLAEAAGVHEKHTVFRHLEVLVLADLLTEEREGYRVNEGSALFEPIRALTDELDRLEPHPLPPSRGRR
jgi:hypothetical protein